MKASASFCATLLISMVSMAAIYAADEPETKIDKPADDSRLTVADYFNWESVSSPQLSPDGERIVYVRTWTDIKTDKRYSNLWTVNFDGTDNHPITSGKTTDGSPRWSPSGDRIAYISGEDNGSQIYVIWPATGRIQRVTNLTKSPSNVTWSPDGMWIAFNMQVPGKKPDGPKMPAKPEGATWAESADVIDRLVYRFDQRGYLPFGYRHIFIVSADGGTERQMTFGDWDHDAPEWSQDGSEIYFSAIRKPDADWVVGDSEVYAVSIGDRSVRTVTGREGPDSSPAVAPRNGTIAYTGFDEQRLSYTVTRLYTMDASGANARCLTPDFDNDTRNVQWTNDGKELLFTVSAKGTTHLHRATLDGKIEQLTDGLFQVGSYDVGANGRIAAIISTPENDGDLYTFTLRRPEPKRLTSVNDDLLSYKKLGALEEIWYESSFDKRQIQGWLIKPPDFDPTKKYPLVLYIHGGPHAMYGIGMSFEFQALAAKDYLVLYTNPRGSTGYGQEFGNIIQYKYPGDDFFDLESGVDEILKRGFADADNLFVTGGSGGGVLTCWVVGRSDRYRAAVSQYPVVNWYSWAGTADIGYSAGWRWFEKWPWEDAEGVMKRSPINLVGNVKTPLMLITGENDWRTPISETEQYYQALKIQKKEAVMVRMPGEAHGVRARPSHYIAKMLFIQEWFDKHKTGAEKKEETTEHE